MPDSLFECTSFKLDALLNMIREELELILDADIYLFFEDDMRGGVS